MNKSGSILLSEYSSASRMSSDLALSTIARVRDKTSSIILLDSSPSEPKRYEKQGGIFVRSGGLIATATEADIARYAR